MINYIAAVLLLLALALMATSGYPKISSYAKKFSHRRREMDRIEQEYEGMRSTRKDMVVLSLICIHLSVPCRSFHDVSFEIWSVFPCFELSAQEWWIVLFILKGLDGSTTITGVLKARSSIRPKDSKGKSAEWTRNSTAFTQTTSPWSTESHSRWNQSGEISRKKKTKETKHSRRDKTKK